MATEETPDLPRIEEDDLNLSPAVVRKDTAGDDPFAQEANVVKLLSGLSPNTKRRITNSVSKKYTGEEDAKTKRVDDNTVITGYDSFQVVQPQYNLDYLAALYELSAPHFAAVRAKAANIVGLGFTLKESPNTQRKLDDLSGDDEGLTKFRKKLNRLRDDILEHLDKCNDEDGLVETLTKVWIDYEVIGNGYLEIGRISTGPREGQIGYIGHIPATTMRVRRFRDGFVQIVSNRAKFFRNFGKDTADPIGNDQNPNEVIHIKKYAPSNTYYGIPDIISAKNSLVGNDFAAKFNLDYFENKAVPRHLITLSGASLSTGAQTQIMEFFETGLQGKNHRSLFIPLPAGTKESPVEFKIQPVEAGVQESSFEKYRASNLQEMLMAHRVPISKVGSAIGMSLANARDADKTFSEQVCQPEQRMAEKKMNKVIGEFTNAFVFKFNEMSLTDAMTQASIDQVYLKNDVYEQNEVRARQGLPGIPKGDKTVGLYSQIELQNKAKATQARATAASGAPAQAQSDQRANSNQNRTRDSQRSTTAPDVNGTGRNPKGEGRQVT